MGFINARDCYYSPNEFNFFFIFSEMAAHSINSTKVENEDFSVTEDHVDYEPEDPRIDRSDQEGFIKRIPIDK